MSTTTLSNALKSLNSQLGTNKTTDSNYAVQIMDKTSGEPKGGMGLENITAGKAKKLENPVTLWGKTFDGSNSISGGIDISGNIIPETNDSHRCGTAEKNWQAVHSRQVVCNINNTMWIWQGANNEIGFATNGKRCGSIISSGYWCIGDIVPNYKLHVNGDTYTSGSFLSPSNTSDRRLKKDIEDFNATEIISKLFPKSFKWNNHANELIGFDTEEVQYGLIAQEVKEILPSFVVEMKHSANNNNEVETYFGIKYEKLIPIMLKAIKEQQEEIEELKTQIK